MIIIYKTVYLSVIAKQFKRVLINPEYPVGSQKKKKFKYKKHISKSPHNKQKSMQTPASYVPSNQLSQQVAK